MKRALPFLLLAGCAHEPMPTAPVVLAEPMRVECPEALPRLPDGHLLTSLGLESPDFLPAGEGDYGLTRESAERIITALRAAQGRINEWRAWAAPTDE